MRIDFLFSDVLLSLNRLFSSAQYTALLGWILSIALLIGGMLYQKNYKGFATSVTVSAIYLALQETSRILYFISVNRATSSLPSVLAIVDATVFSFGIALGYYVSKKAAERVNNHK